MLNYNLASGKICQQLIKLGLLFNGHAMDIYPGMNGMETTIINSSRSLIKIKT